MELLFKNALIPPRPQVPTCYHKDSLPLNLRAPILLLLRLLKIQSLQFKEKKLVI